MNITQHWREGWKVLGQRIQWGDRKWQGEEEGQMLARSKTSGSIPLGQNSGRNRMQFTKVKTEVVTTVWTFLNSVQMCKLQKWNKCITMK